MTSTRDMTATGSAPSAEWSAPAGRASAGGHGGEHGDTRPVDCGGLLGWPAALWLAGSLLWIPSRWIGISAAAADTFLIVGLACFAATVASLAPIAYLSRRPVDELPLGLLATIAIRGGTTLILVVGAIAGGWVDRDAVAVPIVLWYMAFLVTDLIVATRFLSKALPISVRPHTERTTC